MRSALSHISASIATFSPFKDRAMPCLVVSWLKMTELISPVNLHNPGTCRRTSEIVRPLSKASGTHWQYIHSGTNLQWQRHFCIIIREWYCTTYISVKAFVTIQNLYVSQFTMSIRVLAINPMLYNLLNCHAQYLFLWVISQSIKTHWWRWKASEIHMYILYKLDIYTLAFIETCWKLKHVIIKIFAVTKIFNWLILNISRQKPCIMWINNNTLHFYIFLDFPLYRETISDHLNRTWRKICHSFSFILKMHSLQILQEIIRHRKNRDTSLIVTGDGRSPTYCSFRRENHVAS